MSVFTFDFQNTEEQIKGVNAANQIRLAIIIKDRLEGNKHVRDMAEDVIKAIYVKNPEQIRNCAQKMLAHLDNVYKARELSLRIPLKTLLGISE